MSRTGTVMAALVAGSALAGAGYLWSQRERPLALPLPANVLTIVAPVIDLSVAQDAIAAMERLPGDEVTLLLHTSGGCVISCVLLATALRTFPKSKVVVPYMAMSGGTLIALSARELMMGRHAVLSAVDPIIGGERVRHLPDSEPGHAQAKEYELAVTRFLSDTFIGRFGREIPQAHLNRLLEVFLGENAPHAWPIARSQVEALGIPVETAPPMWGETVDKIRRRWRR